MAKSNLLMRADPSGGGSRWLLMVARSSLNSAWRAGKERLKGSFWNFAFIHVFLHSKTALNGKSTCVTVSFFRAELYCSSERSGSPLGNVRRGDLAAISQTPSYHSSGQSPAWTKSIQSDSSFHHKHSNMGFFAVGCKTVISRDTAQQNLSHPRMHARLAHLNLPQQNPWRQSTARNLWTASGDEAWLLWLVEAV